MSENQYVNQILEEWASLSKLVGSHSVKQRFDALVTAVAAEDLDGINKARIAMIAQAKRVYGDRVGTAAGVADPGVVGAITKIGFEAAEIRTKLSNPGLV